jgi:hypothetical protein
VPRAVALAACESNQDSGTVVAPGQSFATPIVGMGYVRVNAFYNAEMNRRIFSAAALLTD